MRYIMGFVEVMLIALGLAMDAFAVSICKGLAMKTIKVGSAAVVGLWFGAFQALMPAIGWFLGSRFASYIEAYDHWIAFALLAFIGINMIREAFGEEDDCSSASVAPKAMIMPAIATSIDALAVGVAFAMVEQGGFGIGVSVLLIGAITFVVSIIGVLIGSVFGSRFKKTAEISGGVILILIGVKIVLEHLGIINF